MSASAHLANCCCVTVLPEPKGPGIAAAPPLAKQKKVSCALWPVISGISGSNFSLYGRPLRTGHFWSIWTSLIPSSVSISAIVSSTVYSAFAAIDLMVPSIIGGTIIFCKTADVSCTWPSTSPPTTLSPTLATGSKVHFFSLSIESTSIPLAM